MIEEGAAYLGKYELRGILGRGGMGVVYEAYDPFIERIVALKTIRLGAHDEDQEEELLLRFKREAQAVGRLSHPNIVQVFEYGEDNGKPFIAMEFVKGRELGDLLERGERYEYEQTISIAEQMLSALAYCHAHGVVHRDLKPANLLMLDDGTVKLTDFGIARVESSTLTRIGAVMGTPNYMSPEQLSGQSTDARSDLFAAGVIIYELLTGEKPFPGNSMPMILTRVMREEFELPSELNVHLDHSWDLLIRRALRKRPADRFQTGEQFLAALRLAAEHRYEDAELDEIEPETMFGNVDDGATVIRPRGTTTGTTRRNTAAASHIERQSTFMADSDERPRRTRADTRAPAERAEAAPVERRSRTPLLVGVGLLVASVLVAGSLWQGGVLDPWLSAGSAPPQAEQTPVASEAPSVTEAWGPARVDDTTAAAPPDAAPEVAVAAPATLDGDFPSSGLDVQAEERAGTYYALVSADTEPAGATLLIDEVEFGVTPLELEVPPGIYNMRLVKSGFDDLQAEVSVDAGTSLRLRGRLVAR